MKTFRALEEDIARLAVKTIKSLLFFKVKKSQSVEK